MTKVRISVCRKDRLSKPPDLEDSRELAPPDPRAPRQFPTPQPPVFGPQSVKEPEIRRLPPGATPGEVSTSGPLAECARIASLSPRELEIVRLVAKGHVNKTIADVLDISPWTVAAHLRRIFAKLHVTSRAAMVARVFEIGTATQAPVARAPGSRSA